MDIKATWGNVVVKIDIARKLKHKFADGTEIQLERGWNNFNLREINPVQGIVLDCYENEIPIGSEVLFQYTFFHPTYEIYNVGQDSGKEVASPYKYFSVPIKYIFAFRYGKCEWKPNKGFLITTRVWKPYVGFIIMPPELVPQRLFVLEGELKDKVVGTLKYCDYEIVFQGDNEREAYLISTKIDEEIVCIDDGLTEKYKNGEIFIGRTVDEAKPIKSLEHAY